MTVSVSSLPPDLEKFVDDALSSGRFPSSDELVCSAIRLLRDREQRLHELRKLLDEGERSLLEDGPIVLKGEKAIHDFFDDLLREGGLTPIRESDE